MFRKPIVPSLSQLSYGIFKFLANHPLFVHPLVYHPITKEHIPISQYRLMAGIPLNEGLTCSIIPGYHTVSEEGGFPSPTSINTSVVYKPFDLGRNNEEAIYHFYIVFQYREVSIDSLNLTPEKDLIKVPIDAVVFPSQVGQASIGQKDMELSINPPFDIISDYLELARLAIYDIVQHDQYPLNADFPTPIRSIDAVHQNYSTSKWSSQANSYFHMGHLLIRINTHVNMGWRDKFTTLLEDINLTLNYEINLKL